MTRDLSYEKNGSKGKTKQTAKENGHGFTNWLSLQCSACSRDLLHEKSVPLNHQRGVGGGGGGGGGREQGYIWLEHYIKMQDQKGCCAQLLLIVVGRTHFLMPNL